MVSMIFQLLDHEVYILVQKFIEVFQMFFYVVSIMYTMQFIGGFNNIAKLEEQI